MAKSVTDDKRDSYADLEDFTRKEAAQLAAEAARIDTWREATGRKPRDYRIGLALSGGGIRSAVFSLGVMQALVKGSLLREFDYLSTVSGGGYIGSALHWWWGEGHSRAARPPQTGFGLDPANFPYGVSDPRDAELRPAPVPGQEDRDPDNTSDQFRILRHLRGSGNYLVPGGGITLASGVAITLRAIFLNLLVWIPIGAAIAYGLLAIGRWLNNWLSGLTSWMQPYDAGFIKAVFPAVATRAGCGTGDQAAMCIDAALQQAGLPLNALTGVFALFADFGMLLLLAFALGAICYALHTYTSRSSNPLDVVFERCCSPIGKSVAVAFTAAALVALWWWGSGLLDGELGPWKIVLIAALGFAAFALVSAAFLICKRPADMPLRYAGRRLFESFYGRILVIAAAVLLLGMLPYVHGYARGYMATTGAASIVLSALGALWGHRASMSGGGGGKSLDIVLPLASMLLLYGVAAVSYDIAFRIIVGPDGASGVSPVAWTAFWVLVFAAVMTGLFTNTNYISLHRFYRDRLMEAFMPDWASVVRIDDNGDISGPSQIADNRRLQDAWDPRTSPGPFPIINANVVLVNSPNRKLRNWGGDCFILTPLFCGSDATGWRKTAKFMGGEMTLASAMAISGAAANPHAGVGGKGPTRRRLVSIVMTLLNFRLGYWVPHPKSGWLRVLKPNHFFPGFAYSVLQRGFNEDGYALELSDGGHFENLGIYELVRRKARMIVVCDGEADKELSYFSFVTVIRRIKERFGATIDFKEQYGPELMVPRKPRAAAYPSEAKFASRGYFVATISYADCTSGLIIYLKTALIRDLSMEALGYAGAHPSFPDESTGDQFFDEEQFEAYRELGYRIGSDMVSKVNPSGIITRLDAGDTAEYLAGQVWERQRAELTKSKETFALFASQAMADGAEHADREKEMADPTDPDDPDGEQD